MGRMPRPLHVETTELIRSFAHGVLVLTLEGFRDLELLFNGRGFPNKN